MATAKKTVKRKPASRAASSKARPKTTKRASSAKSRPLKKTSRFSRNQLVAFILIFAVIGGFFLYRSLAAPPVVARVQGEAMRGGANLRVNGASGGSVKRLS